MRLVSRGAKRKKSILCIRRLDCKIINKHEIEAELSALRLAQRAGHGSSPGRGGGQAGLEGVVDQEEAEVRDLKPLLLTRVKGPNPSSALSHKEKIQLRKNWIICHKCWQWGKHRANEGKLTSAQLQKLTPMDANPESRPTGVPFDSQFK